MKRHQRWRVGVFSTAQTIQGASQSSGPVRTKAGASNNSSSPISHAAGIFLVAQPAALAFPDDLGLLLFAVLVSYLYYVFHFYTPVVSRNSYAVS